MQMQFAKCAVQCTGSTTLLSQLSCELYHMSRYYICILTALDFSVLTDILMGEMPKPSIDVLHKYH